MRKSLIVLFFLLGLFLLTQPTYASEWGGDTGDRNWEIDENGKFTYWTETGKWQGGNRYQTEALVMHRYARANGEPLTGTAGTDYIIVPVYPKSNSL